MKKFNALREKVGFICRKSYYHVVKYEFYSVKYIFHDVKHIFHVVIIILYTNVRNFI